MKKDRVTFDESKNLLPEIQPAISNPYAVSQAASKAAHYMKEVAKSETRTEIRTKQLVPIDEATAKLLFNSMIASNFLFEVMYRLEQTKFFRGKQKMAIHEAKRQCARVLDEEMQSIVDADEASAETVMNLSDYFALFIEQFQMHRFAQMHTHHIAGLGELLEKFHKMPDWMQHHNGIKVKYTANEDPSSQGSN